MDVKMSGLGHNHAAMVPAQELGIDPVDPMKGMWVG